MSDRMLVSLFVTVLAIIGMFFLFDLCIDDESEPGDLGMAAWMYRSEPPPGDGPGRGGDESRSSRRDEDCEDNSGSCRNHPGRDCKGSEDCSTFSPSFEDSPIVVCVQPDACRWG